MNGNDSALALRLAAGRQSPLSGRLFCTHHPSVDRRYSVAPRSGGEFVRFSGNHLCQRIEFPARHGSIG